MANNISGPIWRIDTAPFTYTGPIRVNNLNIVDATAADHVVAKDSDGRTLVDFTANASELDYRVGPLGPWVNGFVVASSGLGTSAVIQMSVSAGK